MLIVMKYTDKAVFLILLLNLNTMILKSQMIVPGSESLLAKLRLNEGIKGIENVMYSEIKGNPFIFKDFRKGILETEEGEKFTVYIRYDIYADEMHIKNDNLIYAIIRPEKIKSIETDSIKFIYSAYSKHPGSAKSAGKSYFIVQAEGKCLLLQNKHLRIQDAEPPKLLQDAKPAVFVHRKDTYYLKKENNNAVLVRNEKDVLSVLTDKKEELNTYLNSKKISMKKAEDLVSLVNYYNGL
jgi:hypothetical protein